MKYIFPNKLKITSLVLIVIGAIGLIIGFLSAPSTVEEANAIVAKANHHDEAHSYIKKEAMHHEKEEAHHGEETHHGEKDNTHHESTESDAHHEDHHGEHLLHQLQNKPWAALYVAALFFVFLSLGILVFYAIQRASQAGWSIILFRVMEAMTAYLFPGLVIVFVILCLSALHFNHLFIWMDPEVVAHDEIIKGKTSYLNTSFFLLRAVFFITGWVLYRHFSRKFSLAQDKEGGISNYKKNFRLSAAFLVFYIVTESLMSWDWIMSIDPHWFSTLFGWYIFAGMFVSGITALTLIVIYLKSKGYLEVVNENHLHDLAKFMFAFSIFWTYLWFSQFMLIWYSNIPEEVTYFITRMEDYTLLFFGMLVLNLAMPILILMSGHFKRVNYLVVIVGIILIIGHYIDVFVLIMPSTVGDQWTIGLSEVSAFLLFLGLFIYIVFNALTKSPLVVEKDPFIEESKQFHY